MSFSPSGRSSDQTSTSLVKTPLKGSVSMASRVFSMEPSAVLRVNCSLSRSSEASAS